jgi:excisionase family DNA binding protein
LKIEPPSKIQTSEVDNTRILYDRQTAARLLSISVSTLDRFIANKALAARRVGRKVLLQHTELMKFSRRDAVMHLTRQSGPVWHILIR